MFLKKIITFLLRFIRGVFLSIFDVYTSNQIFRHPRSVDFRFFFNSKENIRYNIVYVCVGSRRVNAAPPAPLRHSLRPARIIRSYRPHSTTLAILTKGTRVVIWTRRRRWWQQRRRRRIDRPSPTQV